MGGNGLWMWGYFLKTIPGKMMFVDGDTWCGLETAAAYVKADNVVFMDSTTDIANLSDEMLQRTRSFNQVICGLPHFESDGVWRNRYIEAAEKISELSLRHKNISGAVIDDFLDSAGPSRDMSVAEVEKISRALKSRNPKLKLWVVRYSRQNLHEIDPYLAFVDGIIFWVWISTGHYWKYQYHDDIRRFMVELKKPVMQGVFIHDYGRGNRAQPMKMMKLQLPLVGEELRAGNIDGVVLLQNGWFCRPDHRKAVQFARDYFEWHFGTITRKIELPKAR